MSHFCPCKPRANLEPTAHTKPKQQKTQMSSSEFWKSFLSGVQLLSDEALAIMLRKLKMPS